MFRRTGLLSAILLAGAATLAVEAPARAQVDPISCTGSQTAHLAPPMGPVPQETTVQVTERLGEDDDNGTCTGPFDGGIATAVFQQSVSCLVPPPSGSVVQPNVITYNWHGEQSTVTYTVTTVVHVAGQVIVNSAGTVTEGYAEGSPAEREVVVPEPNIADCLASQIEQQAGPMVLIIG